LTDSNFLYFRGLTSDNDTVDLGTHTALVERSYDGDDNSELLIFKGNDTAGASILDRIRYRSGEHIFQTINQSEEVDEHIANDSTGSTNTRMIIDKNGNVGIGTETPGTSLEVSGDDFNTVRIRGEETDAVLQLVTSSTATSVTDGWTLRNDHSDSDKFQMRYNNSSKVTMTSDGNFGIGTTAPSAKLEVVGDIEASNLSTDGVAISCALTSGADFAVQVDKLKVNATTGEVGINKTAASGVDLDVNGIIKASGAVTAGQLLLGDDWDTNSPAGGDKIYIKDTAAPNYSEFALSGASTDSFNNTTAVKSDFPLLISTDSNETANPTSHGILLYNANGTAGTFSPSILFGSRESSADPSGQYRVVSGGIYCRTPLGIGGASSGNYGDGELIFATAGTENGSTTTNSEGPSQRMVIDRSGRVGINNLTPSEVLDVTGNIAASGNVTATDVTATGDISATDITVSGNITQTAKVVVSGAIFGLLTYNGTYVYDSTEDIWYNTHNIDATTGTQGYFFYSDTANRWQFGSSNAKAKATGDSATNTFLSPSTSEAAGFWSTNTNTNWTGGQTVTTEIAQDMSFSVDVSSDGHLATKRYVDSRSALPTISVFTLYNSSLAENTFLSNYADTDSANNLAFAGGSFKTALPDTTGDKTGEFTVPSSGKSLVEINFHLAENDANSYDDYRLWILDENRSTSTGFIAVAPHKSGSSYKYHSMVSWSGYIAPGGKFTVYLNELDTANACEVQGTVKITTYDV